jgi:hypothetical protein
MDMEFLVALLQLYASIAALLVAVVVGIRQMK